MFRDAIMFSDFFSIGGLTSTKETVRSVSRRRKRAEENLPVRENHQQNGLF
jgi:hypothetical protein